MSRGKLKPEDEASIINNYIYLKDEVEAKDIVDLLFQQGVISRSDQECIRNGKSHMERIETLLTAVLHAGPTDAYSFFLESLGKKYPHVKETLKQSVKESYARSRTAKSPLEGAHEPDPKVPQKWTKGKVLGVGKFGKIYLCTESNTSLMFALKEVQFRPGDDKAKKIKKSLLAMENEFDILSQIRHERIIKYYGSRREKDGMSIFLEYMPGGSVSVLLQENGILSEKVAANITKQVLEGLAYLHSKHIVHRHIKAANILRDTLGNIKIADFGIAKYVTGNSGEGAIAPVEETAYWMAPEVIRDEKLTCSADIWSLGCTVVEMMTKDPPFKTCKIANAIHKISTGVQPIYTLPRGSSEDVMTFLAKTFEQDSSIRASAQSLLEHPFVFVKI